MAMSHHPTFIRASDYVDRARELITLRQYDVAIDIVETALARFPNYVNLLTMMTDIYRASGDRKKSLEYANSLIRHHPERPSGYIRAAEDEIALKEYNKAEVILNSCRVRDDRILTLRNSLVRRRQIPSLVQMMQIKPHSGYPHFCIAGNCQSSPLEKWLAISFPFCEITKLTPYHLIKTQAEIDKWITKAIGADFVMMIPVHDGYRGFHFGSEHVRHLIGPKTRFIAYPSFHLETFYPFFSNACNKNGSKLIIQRDSGIDNIYGQIHDFLAMALSVRSVEHQDEVFDRLRIIDLSHEYCSNVISTLGVFSFNEFKRRYPSYTQLIEFDILAGMGHTFNHPSGKILNEIYKLIWTIEFGLSVNSFMELPGEPLGVVTLPVPTFIVKSILNLKYGCPWQIISGNTDHRTYCNASIEEYISMVKNSIQFYNTHPHIAPWNARHKKFLAANAYLNELGI